MLSYHQLSLTQRKSLMTFSVILLMLLAYFPRYENILQQCYQAKLAFQTKHHLFQQQEKLIKNMTFLMQEKNELEKNLAQQDPKLILQQQAQHLDLKAVSFQSDASGYEFNFKTNLKTGLKFLANPAVKKLPGKMTYFKVEQELNQQVINLAIQMEAENHHGFDGNESLAASENNLIIPIDQTEWVGKLTLNHQAPVAFLRLPNQRIIGLRLGESYGDSAWKILAINEQGVKLQDSTNQVITRNFV
jgi:hypothetical protein